MFVVGQRVICLHVVDDNPDVKLAHGVVRNVAERRVDVLFDKLKTGNKRVLENGECVRDTWWVQPTSLIPEDIPETVYAYSHDFNPEHPCKNMFVVCGSIDKKTLDVKGTVIMSTGCRRCKTVPRWMDGEQRTIKRYDVNYLGTTLAEALSSKAMVSILAALRRQEEERELYA